MSSHDPRDPSRDDHRSAPLSESARNSAQEFGGEEPNEDRIPRARTLVRIGLSLVSFLLVRVAETVLVAVILFELIYSLVTERPPGQELRRFANRVVSYLVSIARYLTYDTDCPPFPFSDLPPELRYTPKDPAAA